MNRKPSLCGGAEGTDLGNFGRRMFLKAGGVTLALPVLESLLPRSAWGAGAGDPKRYVCCYIASGTYVQPNQGANWYPAQTGQLNANSLPVVFSPFASSAGQFSIVRGLYNNAKENSNAPGDHAAGPPTYLTCDQAINYNSNSCTVNNASFDQAIAKQNNLTAFAMSASGYDGYHPDQVAFDYGRTVSYLPGQQVETWLNPYKLFYSSGLFGNFTPPAATTTPTPSGTPTSMPTPTPSPTPQNSSAQDKSILDYVLQSIQNLQPKLGTEDKVRLDDYLTGIRTLETQLAPSSIPSTTGGTLGGAGSGMSGGAGSAGSSCANIQGP
ncbi:MAG: hypothetical protein C5B49_12690, partial [Bdellovibrio sp.]